MKKLFLAILASFVAICATAGTVTKHFDRLASFSRINISDFFKTSIVQSDECKVVVTIDSAVEDYLEVNVIGNVLYLRLKERDLKTTIRNISNLKMEATVFCPSLSAIYLTGAASVNSSDKWVSPMEKFTLEMNGATKAEKLRIEGMELKLILSDAANAGIAGNFETLDINATGASVLSMATDCSEVSAILEDTSKVSLIGNTEELAANCKGTSFLDALEMKAENATVECSGASKSNVYVNNKLEVELKGISNCHYRSGNESLVVIPSVSRASSLKRIR